MKNGVEEPKAIQERGWVGVWTISNEGGIEWVKLTGKKQPTTRKRWKGKGGCENGLTCEGDLVFTVSRLFFLTVAAAASAAADEAGPPLAAQPTM